ncbi:hypothetical protein [Lapillicoccus sp.]|uniref:hypothetical protein n=1 Tax=Lapillicoccus sp. TaxID=1909287 RepID=UPI0025D02B73|nr:hypothetical protein [Lapillicoccus sp.]
MSDEKAAASAGPVAPAPIAADAAGGAGALPDYAAMGAAVRTDAERWPTLSPLGLDALTRWRQTPHAPIWVHECGDLLTAEDHEVLGRRRAELLEPARAGRGGADRDGDDPPAWVEALVDRCRRHTTFFGRLGATSFDQLPMISRADLVRDVAAFVPRDQPLDRVVQGTSSGSSGAALVIPLDPVEISTELLLLERLLADVGVDWPHDPDRVGLLSVVDQRQAFTYASVLTIRDDQRMARVNLDPAAWCVPGDRESFLAAARPQVVTGSALSLLALARLDVRLDPLALVSGAVDLTPAARVELEQRWQTTVLDLWGLKETGPLAVSTDGGPHVVVPRRVHLEVVDGGGRALPDGECGELVATVDGNPLLPLLRYRTGDTGSLTWVGDRRAIVGLEGRAPVSFRAADGRLVPSVDLTQQLQHHGARSWSVHQGRDGTVVARVLGGQPAVLREALCTLLGDAVCVETVPTPADLGPGKPRRFSSALDGAG